jgi:NADH:ubiquinone oxidoreductase subunit 2 (subunit N)
MNDGVFIAVAMILASLVGVFIYAVVEAWYIDRREAQQERLNREFNNRIRRG